MPIAASAARSARRRAADGSGTIVVGGFVAYAAVGWFLAGLGASLPALRDEIGDLAGLYPLLPGAVIAASGVVSVRRHRSGGPGIGHRRALLAGVTGAAAGVALMAMTRWVAVGVIGAVVAAFAVALLIRYLPGVLATARPHDVEGVITRANAWSSLASIAGPAAVGLTIHLGAGWPPGMIVPLAAAAAASVWLLRGPASPARRAVAAPADPGTDAAAATPAAPPADEVAESVIPPLRTWLQPWLVLWLGIVVEFCFSYFAATFLHDQRGLSTAAAAAGAAAWGAGMTIGRFVVSARRLPRSVTPLAVTILVGFVLFWAVPNPWVSITGILVAGLGAAPLYPSLITTLLERFPRSVDQGSTRGSLASGSALLAAPALMIALRAVSNVRWAYLAVPVLLVVLVLLAAGASTPRRAREDGTR